MELARDELARRTLRSMWRYAELLPVDKKNVVSLDEGFTPLLKASSLERRLGAGSLSLKLELACPTGSFKDRGASLLVSKAKELGVNTLVIDSSGNAGVSLSAYSARAGLMCYVFVPAYASAGKIVQCVVGGAHVIRVEGTRRDTFEITRKAYQRYGWYYCGFQMNPFASQGAKTIAYEICEQFDWSPPDWIVFPVGTGSALIGAWKGFKELHELNWIKRVPSLVSIQPTGCAPIATAYKKHASTIEPVAEPKTVAEGLMIGNPLRGEIVLKAMEETGGCAEDVTDQDILEAGKFLAASEGIFAEPSAAASVAGTIKLLEQGRIEKGERIACILTGSGLKSPESYSRLLAKPRLIQPSLAQLETAISSFQRV